MKIILTESQHKKLVEGIFISDEEKNNRLKQSIELSKDFKNPRQFKLAHPKLYYFLRGQNLIDVVFPDRKKYKPDGYWTIDTIGQEAMKYDSRTEFEQKNQWAYIKAKELGIMDALFPNRKTNRDFY